MFCNSTITDLFLFVFTQLILHYQMKTPDMIKELCNKKNISLSELARRIGQTPQNFGKKMKRDTVTLEELKLIADVMGVTFEQSFIFLDGEQIKTSNK